MLLSLPLSKLAADRRNPRRVRPEREAHRRLVASIRAYGLLEPLVVRRNGQDRYHVVAGGRRLDALREIHRGEDPRVPCRVVKADGLTAEAMSLSENFAREGLHPLDEADAFARLAREEAKGVEAIAAEFGVTERYVRQRMTLSTLAEPVRAAYREYRIDTGTAEAFAAVPPDRQLAIWEETAGNPRHAQHVRNLIEHAWIDAAHALFPVDTLPANAVSRDLFGDRVLVERQAFMAAQTEALAAQRTALLEDGWAEAVAAPQAEVQDRLYALAEAPPQYDPATTRKLEKLEERHEQLGARLEQTESDEEAAKLQSQLEELEGKAEVLTKDAEVSYTEATKASGTAFLILDPDGRVRREFRVPRSTARASSNGAGTGGALPAAEAVPTSDDLGERQTGATFTHEALAVREALLRDERTRRIVLALILHEKVRKEALAIRQDANGTDLYAGQAQGFTSKAFAAMQERRNKLDPLREAVSVDEAEAFAAIGELSPGKLDELIAQLTVRLVTAHLIRPTPLVRLLARRLKIDVRRHWRPDEGWLSGYKKIQLANLIGKLRGPAHGSAAEHRKKSELVAELARLFVDAAEGRLEDAAVTAQLNAWLPANLRSDPSAPVDEK